MCVCVYIVPALRGEKAYDFVFNTGPLILRVNRCPILLHWLNEVTAEVASTKILRERLHYERRTWPLKHDRIQGLCQTCITDIGLVDGGLVNVSRYPLQNDTMLGVINTEILDHLDRLLRRGLMEVRRLVSYEVQYSQCIVAEYFLQPVQHRGIARRSLRTLRTHLQATGSSIKNMLDTLDPWNVEFSPPMRNGFVELWKDRLDTKVAYEAPPEARTRYVAQLVIHDLFQSNSIKCAYVH